jgi:hypothetical protein
VPAPFKHIFLAGLKAEPGSCGRGELGRGRMVIGAARGAHADWG